MKKTIKKIAALAILTGFVILAAFPFAPIMAHAQSTGGTQGGGYLNSIVTNGLNTGPGTTLNTQPSTQKSTTPSAPNDPWSCSASTGTCIVFFVFYFINQILNFLIQAGAFFFAGFLAISNGINTDPTILTGFSISLAFANLGFVLFLIIIAVATIIRIESYGMKKNLFKLIAMAILVNFGLVITIPVIGFSNNLSGYFVNQIAPPSGGHDLATIVTAAFKPQAFNTRINATSSVNVAGWVLGGAGGATGGIGGAIAGAAAFGAMGSIIPVLGTGIGIGIGAFIGGIGGSIVGGSGGYAAGSIYHAIHDTNFNDQFVQTLLGMATSSIILAVVAFTLLVAGIELLVRYVYLNILLILLPLAWLAYVLPGMKSHFSKWWNLFLKWTFFPVIVLFFLYLALLIASSGPNTISFITTTPTGLAGQALQDIVLAGLILGGLFAANSLGLAGSKAVQGFFGDVKDGIAGYAGGLAARQGKRGAARLVPQKTMEKLQSGGVPLLPKRLQVAAGLKLGDIHKAGTSKLVEQDAAWAKENGKDVDLAARLLHSGGISESKKFALLKNLLDNKKFDPEKIKDVDGVDIHTFLQDKNRFNTHKQGVLRDDLHKSITGAPADAANLINTILTKGKEEQEVPDEKNITGKGENKMVNALELLRASLEKAAASMDKGSAKKQRLNYMYSDKTLGSTKIVDGKAPAPLTQTQEAARMLRKEQLRAIIHVKPEILASHIPGMNKKQQDNFKELLEEVFKEEENNKPGEKDQIDKIRTAFIKNTSMTSLMSAPSAEEPEAKKEEGGEGKDKK